MRTLLAIAIAGWTLFAADGAREGREGNARYQAGAYPAAASAYEKGLAERDAQVPSALTSALWNNRGLALHRADSTAEALGAFQDAFATAPTTEALARAAYNAGTAAAQAKRDEAALERLRQALLTDPSHEAARYNFELVKRQLEREKQQQKQPPQQPPPPDDIQPSPFAERLKARADTLVGQQQYEAAYRLLAQGLRQDSTVRAFGPFMQRTGAVAQIDTVGTQQ